MFFQRAVCHCSKGTEQHFTEVDRTVQLQHHRPVRDFDVPTGSYRSVLHHAIGDGAVSSDRPPKGTVR